MAGSGLLFKLFLSFWEISFNCLLPEIVSRVYWALVASFYSSNKKNQFYIIFVVRLKTINQPKFQIVPKIFYLIMKKLVIIIIIETYIFKCLINLIKI